MSQLRFTISTHYRKDVEHQLKNAQRLGQVRKVKYLLAILAVMAGQHCETVARTLQVTPPTVREWLRLFLCYGVKGAPRRKSSGRPAKLSKAQQAQLARLIEAGPRAAGFSGACWRSPMVQQLIHDRCGVLYNVFYIALVVEESRFFISESQVCLRPSG